PLGLQPIDDLRYQFEVNVFGQMAVTQAFLPLLGAQENPGFPPGRIIQISSVGGKFAGPFLGAYSGSKHALEGLSSALRIELQLYGIDVIVIGPGAIKTPIWDKPSAQEVGIYAGSPYEPMMRKFQKYFVTGGQDGLDSDWLGERIADISEKRKPKVRYAFVPDKLRKWTIPRLLPVRMVDRIIGKATGLLKK
ncbi:MAG: SDR family NAD(P)-dependent oxidoreductase, partial [Bacteroidia bacterium]